MLGSYLKVHLVYMQKTPLCYMQDLCSAWWQSKVAGDNDKSLLSVGSSSLFTGKQIDNCLSASICHYGISNKATVNYEQKH